MFVLKPMLRINLNPDILFKFIKFGIVGLSGLFVDFGITYFCKEKLKISKYVSNSLGFVFATINNFLFNRYWTFNSVQNAPIIQFSKFFGIALIGLLLNNLLIYLLNDRLKMNFYLSKAFAIVIVSILNFSGNYLYTFAA
ncbi:MAG: GtrA family protein [Daejeonella sp.]